CTSCGHVPALYSVLSPWLTYSFFFSSRRRHTRSKRDWSSDVCSSDLKQVQKFQRDYGLRVNGIADEVTRKKIDEIWDASDSVKRSEERRVGKECRARRAPGHEIKKKVMTSRGQMEEI